jgi:hypothetical protein
MNNAPGVRRFEFVAPLAEELLNIAGSCGERSGVGLGITTPESRCYSPIESYRVLSSPIESCGPSGSRDSISLRSQKIDALSDKKGIVGSRCQAVANMLFTMRCETVAVGLPPVAHAWLHKCPMPAGAPTAPSLRIRSF